MCKEFKINRQIPFGLNKMSDIQGGRSNPIDNITTDLEIEKNPTMVPVPNPSLANRQTDGKIVNDEKTPSQY